MHDVIMLEKMWILKGLANMKGWIFSLSILLQVLLNKMAMLNVNLLPFSMGCKSCSKVECLLS